MKEFINQYLVLMSVVFVITYISYIYIMKLKMKRDDKTLNPIIRILAFPVLIMGLLYDVLLNILFGSLIFQELPKEWLLTSRLKRHKLGNGWKAKMAKWLCDTLLNPFDDGHC